MDSSKKTPISDNQLRALRSVAKSAGGLDASSIGVAYRALERVELIRKVQGGRYVLTPSGEHVLRDLQPAQQTRSKQHPNQRGRLVVEGDWLDAPPIKRGHSDFDEPKVLQERPGKWRALYVAATLSSARCWATYRNKRFGSLGYRFVSRSVDGEFLVYGSWGKPDNL